MIRAIIVISAVSYNVSGGWEVVGVSSFVHVATSTENLLRDVDKMKIAAERRGGIFDYELLSDAP